MIENINEIQEYLNTNKDNEDVVGLINSLKTPLNIEGVMEFCNTEKSGKSFIDSVCDKYAEKAKQTAVENALKKYQEEEVPKLVEAELTKFQNKGKTPLEIKVAELEKQNENMLKQIQMKELESKYKDTLSEQGLDLRLMKFLPIGNEEEMQSGMSLFSEIINNSVELKVKERLGDSSDIPPKQNGNIDNSNNPWSKGSINLTRQALILKENPELANQLKALAK
jgi:vacuolar-type H+-ATPase subunit I/STV1